MRRRKAFSRTSCKRADPMTDPRDFNRPDRIILPEGSTDRLGLAVLALCRELWVMKDRQAILEAVLERNGVEVSSAIEAFQPDPEFSDRLTREGTEMLQSIVDILADKA